MGIYIFIYLYNAILAIAQIFVFKNKRMNLMLILGSFITINLFSCLVYSNGGDWGLYQGMYLKIPPLSTLDFEKIFRYIKGNEFGTNLIMSVGKIYTNNYEIFKYILLTLILMYIYIFLEKKTRYTLFVISIYLSENLLSAFFEPILRQLLALVIFLFAMEDLIKKRKIYFFKVFLAYLFHSSAIILFPIFFIKRKIYKKKKLLILFLGLMMGIFILPEFIKIIVKNISYLNVYSYYLNSNKFIGKGLNLNRLIVLTIKIIIYIIPVFYLNGKIKKRQTTTILFYNLTILYVSVYILQQSVEILVRFNMYFNLFYIILVEKMIGKIKLRKNKLKVLGFFLIYFFLSYWKNIDTFKERYIPYTNYIVEILNNRDYKNQWEKIRKNKAMSDVLKWEKR